MHAIDVVGVGKDYRSSTALKNCDLAVESGRIVGLLGPNGAGKSTLMRIISGLVRQDSGSVNVLGGAPGAPDVAGRMGVTIEAPAFYPWLNGRRNVQALLAGGRPRISADDIDETLAKVGLGEREMLRKRTSAYSQGMRQRLALAVALVGKPELLILDEPGNGLDPEALVELRKLLLGERDRGATVLVSSHQLHEIGQVCDSVAVIRDGRVRAVRDLRPGGSGSGDLEQFYLATMAGAEQ